MDNDYAQKTIRAIYANGGSITRPGNYDLTQEEASAVLEMSLKRGKSLFPTLDLIVWAGWDRGIISNAKETLVAVEEFKGTAIEDFYDLALCERKAKESIRAGIEEEERLNSYEYRRMAASVHTSKTIVRRRIFRRDGKRCRICNSGHRLTIDHIIPVVKGGGNEDENLQVLCHNCNARKGSK